MLRASFSIHCAWRGSAAIHARADQQTAHCETRLTESITRTSMRFEAVRDYDGASDRTAAARSLGVADKIARVQILQHLALERRLAGRRPERATPSKNATVRHRSALPLTAHQMSSNSTNGPACP